MAHPQCGRYAVRLAGHLQRLLEHGQHTLGCHLVGQAEQTEGVARHPGQHNVSSQQRLEPVRNGVQQQIGIGVAHHVVHAGKVIHIHQHHTVPTGAGLNDLVDVFDELGAVGQAQQSIDIRFGVQALHQRQVAQASIQVDTEHVQQAAVDLAQHLVAADEGGHVQATLDTQVQHRLVRPVLRPAFLQALPQQLRHTLVIQGVQGLVDQGGVVSRRRQHPVLTTVALTLGAHQTLGAHTQNGRHLCDDTRSKIAQALRLQECATGLDDQLQATPTGLDGAKLVIRPQRSGHGGDEFVVRQLGLGFVVIDVVTQQGFQLGGITGLPRSQHDARGPVTRHVADEIHQLQTRIGGFHDHIQQHQGNVGLGHQQVASLRSGMGMHQLNAALEQHSTLQRKARGLMHIGIVVDDHDGPDARRTERQSAICMLCGRFVGKQEFVG